MKSEFIEDSDLSICSGINQQIFADIYKDLYTYLEKRDCNIMELVGEAHDTKQIPVHC